MCFEKDYNFSLLSPERLILGDLIFNKIKQAILEKNEKATLFMMIPVSGETKAEGVVFTIDKNQFPIFLDRYLKICESEEMFELCSEIIHLRKECDFNEENEICGN